MVMGLWIVQGGDRGGSDAIQENQHEVVTVTKTSVQRFVGEE
jgi:hypothetical protein